MSQYQLASAIYILFAFVPVIMGIFLVITFWKIAKAHETLANSTKEIAEALKSPPQ